MANDRTDFDMKVEFTHPETGEKGSDRVYIPFDIFMEAIKQYCDRYKGVVLEGNDNAIWNMFADLYAIDNFVDDDSFVELCTEMYKGSTYEEEDFEDWKDMYDYKHNLGEYAKEED